MSRIFLAHETRLGRTVVVKVLLPELAAGVSAERFEREIRVAARLQHPSIVPVLTTGETDGLPYYTMPFVAGASLRARLAGGGAIALDECVRILRDIARALDYAHGQGVVHRDIKPENVLLSGDGAVITDFGIAKALDVSRSVAPAGTLTQAGTAIGTPQYMSPEQVTGDPNTDHRTDIYAFGVTAYEMLARAAPFADRAPHAMLAAQVAETPPSVRAQRADTPAALADLVARCLEKSPALRPQSARELLTALDAIGTPTGGDAVPPSARWRGLAAGLLVVVVIATVVWNRSGRAGPPAASAANGASVVVIPFLNVGGDSTQEYFADGVSDELSTALGKVPGLRVAARSGAYRYRARRDLDTREVARELSVTYVVQGKVFRSGQRLRVSAQVSDAARNEEVWSESFERDAKDLFAVQDDISRAITKAMQARLSFAPKADVATRGQGTANPEAYDAYMRGAFYLRRRIIPPAIESYQKAIALDARFARAYGGLSQAFALSPYFAGMPAREVAARSTAAAQRTLALDSTVAEAHTSLGLVAMHDWRWEEAAEEFRRASLVDPTDPSAHFQYGRWLYYRDDLPGAIAEWERSRAIDPFAALYAGWIAQALMQSGNTRAGLNEVKRALELDSTTAVVVHTVALSYLLAGDRAQASRVADRLPKMAPWIGTFAYIKARTGDTTAARQVITGLTTAAPMPWFGYSSLAFAYLGLGDPTRALDALERATDAREIWPSFHRVGDPIFDLVRQTPRFRALVERVGLGRR
jgi:serine/threonine-protein kinase